MAEKKTVSRSMTKAEIEERMLKTRQQFNASVRVQPSPKYTKDARLSTVFPAQYKEISSRNVSEAADKRRPKRAKTGED